MTEHDVLVGFRLRLFTLAEEPGNVSAACRAMGVHRSTYYRLKHRLDRYGLEALKVRERRGRGCRTRSALISSSGSWPSRSATRASGRAGSLLSWRGRSGAGSGSRSTASGACSAGWGSTPARSGWRSWPATATPTSASLRCPSPSATSKPRSRARRCKWTASTSAGCRAPRAPSGSTPRSTSPRPTPGPSSEPPSATPRARHTRELVHRVARELKAAGWKLSEVGTDNGSEFRSRQFGDAVEALGARQRFIKAGRPNSNGCVERLQLTIPEQCWRPAFARSLVPKMAALQRDLDEYLTHYNHHRTQAGRLTNGHIPADIVSGARNTRTIR